MATATPIRFQFNQKVQTPKGPATFIAYFVGGDRVQVARYIKATELSMDECLRCRPSVYNMTEAEFDAWQKSTAILRNEIYPVWEISQPNGNHKALDDYTKPDDS